MYSYPEVHQKQKDGLYCQVRPPFVIYDYDGVPKCLASQCLAPDCIGDWGQSFRFFLEIVFHLQEC
jgi:hypothetical protein